MGNRSPGSGECVFKGLEKANKYCLNIIYLQNACPSLYPPNKQVSQEFDITVPDSRKRRNSAG